MQASRMFVGVISMMITACTIWEPTVCPSGRQCPPGMQCAAAQDICISDGCGDGFVAAGAGETCDDGNKIPGDGCSADCRSNEDCGNDVLDPGEQCDDGNILPGGGCGPTCLLEICGNGFPDPGEQCDNGDTSPGGGCGPICLLEVCGNGFVDPGEQCDDGNNAPGDRCGPTCLREECGNGFPDPGEQCDDGNNAPGGGCGPTCLIEACGNAFLDPDEECDCGTGTVAPGCEGANSDTGGVCNTSCQMNCGDGLPDDDEECDFNSATPPYCTDHEFDMGLGRCDDQCKVSKESCENLGWNPMPPPIEFTSTLRDIWGDPETNTVLAVGDDGSVIRFDGSSWEHETSLAGGQWKGISGTGPEDIWIVGDNGNDAAPAGRIFHFDGSQWREDSSFQMLPALRSIWSHLPGNTFAVGDGGAIRHLDGFEWTTMACSGGGRFSDVWGSGPNNVVAVSLDGGICHYNGMVWQRFPLEPPAVFPSFHSVWEGYAVGAGGEIYERGGTGWNPVEPRPTSNALHGVWVAPEGNAFAVGAGGTILAGSESTWSHELFGGADLFGVWGTHRNNVFAVGAGGQIWHRGATWISISLSAPGGNAVLNDVSIAGGTIYTVGNGLYANGIRQEDDQGPITANLHGIWVGQGVRYAVGDNGTIYKQFSDRWTKEPTQADSHLKSVWGSGDSIFAVGAAGTILHATDGSWFDMASGTDEPLNSVWGSSASNVFAVGDNGTILRFDGESWTDVPSPTDDHLRSVWVSDAGDVFVLSGDTSQASGIWRRAGSEWLSMPLPPGMRGLEKLRGTAPDDIFAVGIGGQVLHYNGVAWAPIATRTFSSFRGLWATPDRVLVVGDSSYELATLPR